MGHKFGERRRPVCILDFRRCSRDVALLYLRLRCQLPGLALDSPRHLAFLPHEATPVSHLTSAVDDRSVPRVEQELRALSLEFAYWRVLRLLEPDQPITLQTISSLLMVGFAWPHFVSLWSGRCGIVSARQNVSAIARLNKPAPDTEISGCGASGAKARARATPEEEKSDTESR